jgi:nucleotide-binding universal stress UspA family protein
MVEQRILVPVDGSSHSRRAVEYAVQIARLMHREILLVHCHKPFPSLSGEPYYQKAISKILMEADQLLVPFRDRIRQAEIPFVERILEGQPGLKSVMWQKSNSVK